MSHRRESTPPDPAERRSVRPSVRPPAGSPSAAVVLEPERKPARAPRSRSAADCLAAALRARTSQARAEWARRGLAIDTEELDPELQVLLLRQLYLSFVEEDQLSSALAIADQMARVGPMRDIALHDRARALWAREGAPGDVRQAIEAQRQAARVAPPDRRSFHAMALGTLLHFAGEHDAALRALDRAERWSHRDRALIRGFRAYVALDADLVPEGIEEARQELGASPLREGYGQFVLGMIAFRLGDRRRAAVHLRAFLRKNASVDRAKALTLREELRRARRALADLESD